MKKLLFLSLTVISMAPLALPQDRATVPFSDPSRPKKLVVDTMFGSVTVRGYNGQEVIVETTARDFIRARGRKEPEPPTGMHRKQHDQGERRVLSLRQFGCGDSGADADFSERERENR